jgi:aryl-alcohol dehydrogenase-like predicted oxidoreductase
MKKDRREFLRYALASSASLMTSSSLFSQQTTSIRNLAQDATQKVPLGKTGISASFLAQGTGFNGGARSSAHTRLGKEKLDRLLRYNLDRGVNFMDMADLYGSHEYVRDAIKGLPRENLVLLSKIWPREENWVTPSGGAIEEIDRFRRELGTEMIDICLIHCMLNGQWTEEYKGIRDELSELKQKGAIRAVGVSCHDFEALKLASQHPWVDVIFARINNMGGREYSMDGSAEEVAQVLKTARSNGKAVVGMKIFGAGKLVEPQQKDASLKWVIENDLVDAMTIGGLSIEEVDDSITRINKTLKV